MRIDVHAHLWSEAYLDLLERFGRTSTGAQRQSGAGPGDAEMQARLALMDRAGVEMQILSSPPQAPHFEDAAHALEAARRINNEYAETVDRWPRRFKAFASLPLPHVEPSLAELRRALDELGMVGVAITTAILGRSIADPAFAPIYQELDRRGSVLFIHPEGCGCHSPLIQKHNMTWMVGAPIEDTVAVMHLIAYGIPSRYPKLKIVNSHLGGAIPMLLQRLDHQYRFEAPDAPEKPSDAAKRMWYDTVGHNHRPALRAAVESFGADRLVLGTDFPFLRGEVFQGAIDYIADAGLDPEAARRIRDVNAARLLGLFDKA
ncbi:aminocarboxymuconate-semialdehyde decarboxylase [Rhizobiales bacterium GAS113]|nr:aminocarboxymuconate-semialdehyde decarboxylase [Rhizobiales bacterium GAS113]